MRIGSTFVLLTLAAARLYSQATPPVQIAVVPGIGANGMPDTVFANSGTGTVTAVAVSRWPRTAGTPLTAPAVSLWDAADQLYMSPIMPGRQEAMGFVFSQDPTKPGPEPIAVLFEDGSSWGDLKWVRQMVQRRQYLLQRLSECLQGLLQDQRAGADRAAVVAHLQAAMDSALAASADALDRTCVRMAWQEPLVNMRNATGFENHPDALLQGRIDDLKLRLIKLRSYGNIQ